MLVATFSDPVSIEGSCGSGGALSRGSPSGSPSVGKRASMPFLAIATPGVSWNMCVNPSPASMSRGRSSARPALPPLNLPGSSIPSRRNRCRLIVRPPSLPLAWAPDLERRAGGSSMSGVRSKNPGYAGQATYFPPLYRRGTRPLPPMAYGRDAEDDPRRSARIGDRDAAAHMWRQPCPGDRWTGRKALTAAAGIDPMALILANPAGTTDGTRNTGRKPLRRARRGHP